MGNHFFENSIGCWKFRTGSGGRRGRCTNTQSVGSVRGRVHICVHVCGCVGVGGGANQAWLPSLLQHKRVQVHYGTIEAFSNVNMDFWSKQACKRHAKVLTTSKKGCECVLTTLQTGGGVP